jgi:GR25 family glycosyltransferase involved in LPS biosynthesis
MSPLSRMYHMSRSHIKHMSLFVLIGIVAVACFVAMQRQTSIHELFVDGFGAVGKGGFGISRGMDINEQIINLDNLDIYLINMTKNKERLDHFARMYSRSDMNKKKFSRLEAVDGRNVDLEKLVTPKALNEILSSEKHGYRTKHYQLTRGAVGCYLSHLSIYNLMQDSPSEMALIFEDDARFGPNVLSQINKAMARVPFDWDMFNLSCFCIKCNKYPEYTDVQQFFWMHAYIIKKDAAKKIIDHAVRTGIDKQIDSALGDMIQLGTLKVYCARTGIVSQSNFKTTIQMPLKTVTGVNPYSLE